MGWKTGRRYAYRPPGSDVKAPIIFWAEKGSICIIDERYPEASDEFFIVLSIREWLQNLRGVNASLGRFQYGDERNAAQNMIDNGIACAREAQRQGDPLNPKHARDMILQRRKSMLLAGKGDYFKPGALSTSHAPEGLLLPPLPTPSRVLTASDLE